MKIAVEFFCLSRGENYCNQAAAVSNEKLAGPIDGVGQCFSEKKVVILIVVF